jgi:hypothetical protein
MCNQNFVIKNQLRKIIHHCFPLFPTTNTEGNSTASGCPLCDAEGYTLVGQHR